MATSKSIPKRKKPVPTEHLSRVRRICSVLPGTTEKLSHGEPTFFVAKKVFTMFANNHHDDGHIAVWLPAAPGEQAALIGLDPKTYFRPPYVGVKGWIGVELETSATKTWWRTFLQAGGWSRPRSWLASKETLISAAS